MVVLPRVPFLQTGQLGGDGLEEANNHTDRRGLHVFAKLVDSALVRYAVVAVELHLFPDGQENGGKHENCRPILQLVARVHRAVQAGKLLKDVLLQLTPHISKSALDLEVDHDRSDSLSKELGAIVVDLADELFFFGQTLHHGDVECQVVRQHQLQSLSDRGRLLALVVTESRLQDLGQERSALEILIDKRLKAGVKMTIQILRQQSGAHSLHTGRQLRSVDLELGVGQRFDPVHAEALVVPDEHLAGIDRQIMTVSMGDVERPLKRAEALDVADGEAEANMTLVVGLPVLHEVRNILDVHTRTWDLPQTGMARSAATTWLTLVASLLEKLTPQTSTQLPDLMSLLTLVRSKWASSSADFLLCDGVFPRGMRNLLDDGLRGLAFQRRFSATEWW